MVLPDWYSPTLSPFNTSNEDIAGIKAEIYDIEARKITLQGFITSFENKIAYLESQLEQHYGDAFSVSWKMQV